MPKEVLLEERVQRLIGQSRFSQALEVVEGNPRMQDASFYRAFLLGKRYSIWGKAGVPLKQKDKHARAMYRKALRIKPDSIDARVELSKLLIGQGELSEAFEVLEKASDDARVYSLFGKIYDTKVNLDEDMDEDELTKFSNIFRKALKIATDKTKLYYFNVLLAEVALKLDKYDDAVKYSSDAISINYRGWLAHYLLAQAYALKGDALSAVDEAKKSAMYAPKVRSKELSELIGSFMGYDGFRRLFSGFDIPSNIPSDTVMFFGVNNPREYAANLGSDNVITIKYIPIGDNHIRFMSDTITRLTRIGNGVVNVVLYNHDGNDNTNLSINLDSKKAVYNVEGSLDEISSDGRSPSPTRIYVTQKVKKSNNSIGELVEKFTSSSVKYELETFEISFSVEDDTVKYKLTINYNDDNDTLEVKIADFKSNSSKKEDVRVFRLREGLAMVYYLFGDMFAELDNPPDYVKQRIHSFKPRYIRTPLPDAPTADELLAGMNPDLVFTGQSPD